MSEEITDHQRESVDRSFATAQETQDQLSKKQLSENLDSTGEHMNDRLSMEIGPDRRGQINALIPYDDIVLTKQGEHIHSFSKDISRLTEPPSTVECLLVKNEMLYVGDDGKLYFTPKAIQFYVPRALVPIGKPEEILGPGINLFGMPCIDGRYKFPDNFAELPLEEKIKINVGSLPGGGAGMLMTLMSSLRRIFDEQDPHYIDYIKQIIVMLLEHNKEHNPDGYKIQWHTDCHPKQVDGFTQGCGCGFLTNAQADPESYGLNSEMMDFVIDILHNPDWSDEPVKLGEHHSHLEHHKERCAMILLNGDENSLDENFVLLKQIDFSPMLTTQELESLNEEEQQELHQMAFTANFRSYPVLVSEAMSIIIEYMVQTTDLIEHVVLSQDDKRMLKIERDSYFDVKKSRTTAGDAVLALLKKNIKNLMNTSTGHIKNKLSGAPLVTVDVTTENIYKITVTFDH